MINYSLYMSGPKIQTLAAIAHNQFKLTASVMVSRMHRDGLVEFKTVPGRVEGITHTRPVITPRGRVVLDLIEADVEQYLRGR
jgi:hypothetical protein